MGSDLPPVRSFLAPNPGPFTADGTRTHVLGTRRAVVIDPGPEILRHLERVAEDLREAEQVTVLVTHRHADHAGGAGSLASLLDAPLRGYGGGAVPFEPGERVPTDHGDLVPLDTPGHTERHYSFLLEDAGVVFPGDLVLGVGDTTWVAEYPGCVRDYLGSLDVVERIPPRILYPAHGPPVTRPLETIQRFRDHRLARIRQVRDALAAMPGADEDALLQHIYGDTVPEALQSAARRSLQAILQHLRG